MKITYFVNFTVNHFPSDIACAIIKNEIMVQSYGIEPRNKLLLIGPPGNGKTSLADVFKRGFTGIRDLFTRIKDIRKWDSQDRIAETHATEYWRESLEFDGNSPASFEIELFYRSD